MDSCFPRITTPAHARLKCWWRREPAGWSGGGRQWTTWCAEKACDGPATGYHSGTSTSATRGHQVAGMSRLESYFGYAETHRLAVCVVGSAMVILIAWGDALLPTMSIGFLYLIPIVLTAAALNGLQIVIMAALCALLREAYDPLEWAPGAIGRMIAAGAGFAMAGFFVTGLHQRGRMLQKHLREVEEEVRLRKDVESQIEALIETSPLAILTLDRVGRVVLANDSARRLLEFADNNIQGAEVAPYLPILPRMLQRHDSGGSVRTNVECKARRRDGEIFLANIWV